MTPVASLRAALAAVPGVVGVVASGSHLTVRYTVAASLTRIPLRHRGLRVTGSLVATEAS